MATEAQVSKAIVKGLHLCGHHAFKTSDKFTAGVADILGTYSSVPGLVAEGVFRPFVRESRMWEGRSLAIETKLSKAWPKRLTSKVLQHEVSRAQFEFLKSVADRGGLAYVAVAGPAKSGRGVEVWLIPFAAWKAGSEGLEGKNVLMSWLAEQPNHIVPLMRGSLNRGFLASAGPLETEFR